MEVRLGVFCVSSKACVAGTFPKVVGPVIFGVRLEGKIETDRGFVGGQLDAVVWIAAIIVGLPFEAEADLAKVAHAFGASSFFFCVGKNGQQHRGEDGDDRNSDEKFDQRES